MTTRTPTNLIEAIQSSDAPTIIAFAQFATQKTREHAAFLARQLLEKWEIERVIALMHEAQKCDQGQFFINMATNFARLPEIFAVCMGKCDLPGCACALLCGLDIVEGFKSAFPMSEEALHWFIENLGYACDLDDLSDIADFLDRESADELAEIIDDYAESICSVRGTPKKR